MLDMKIATAADGSTISFTDLEDLIERAQRAADALAPLEDQVGDLESELDALEMQIIAGLFHAGRCRSNGRWADEDADFQVLKRKFRAIWGDDAVA
jgi:hypothetical protein